MSVFVYLSHGLQATIFTVPSTNQAMVSLKVAQVHTRINFRRIELVGQVWSGFEFATKPDQPGLSSLICLEVIKDKRKIQF